MESRLVLHAVGIVADTEHRDGWWCLLVRQEDVAVATAELEAYRQENPTIPKPVPRITLRRAGAEAGVLVYVGVLLYVSMLDEFHVFGLDWQAAGRVQSEQVVNGQWWRCITALTLHVDPGHLIANVVFGAVFGLIAGRILGGGIAWLAIIIAGAIGNFVNSLIQSPMHLSIGASTAVFASLGLIVVDSLRGRGADQESLMRRWSPLIGGLILFAYTGIGGEHTDVGAHLAGFATGMFFGWIASHAANQWLSSQHVQKSAGLAAILLVIASWIIALSQ